MKPNPEPPSTGPATLQTVLDRIAGDGGLSDICKRGLRSAVTSFAKLMGRPLASIPLDLADICRALVSMVPGRAQISSRPGRTCAATLPSRRRHAHSMTLRLIATLVQLPDRLWHRARRGLATSRWRSSTCKLPLRSIFSSTSHCASSQGYLCGYDYGARSAQADCSWWPGGVRARADPGEGGGG
jgi:hypothetical protein